MNGGMFLTGGQDDIGLWEMNDGKFKRRANMLLQRAYHCMTSLQTGNDTLLYAIGGRYFKKESDTCEFYSVKDNMWTRGPNLTRKRTSPTVITANDNIYVIGGYLLGMN